jgi:lipopolysaccharide/colanic/teichoic acid biosynthesis glycosyltransferase
MTLYDIGKRILDVVGSVIGIIIFSPVMLITAGFIKLVSPKGPIFADTPKRVGKDGNDFEMYKFRSMIPNAHQWLLDHPGIYKEYKANSYKLDPDPRLLPGAKFMRKFSIDELPQFFNILVGSMSLVGPRAYYPFELKEQMEKYPESKKDIDMALTVKPGLTGPWQTGGRSNIGFVDRVKIDAGYAKKRSLVYDLLVVLKTPYVVLTKRGAM